MFLKSLSLVNYKNFDSKNLDFDPTINCLVGKNGVGKTNILDAIYHLCFGKSYFNPVATQNIKHGTEFFMIDGAFEKNDRQEKIVCSFKKGMKKVIKRNGKAYDKFSEHIGFLPLVIISPADRDLIVEGSETRRKFIDGVKSALEKDRALQYTSVGIHKDDLDFTIDGYPIKKFGSQGQQKSFLIALKLAQFYFIKKQAKTTPILLLDDIFDKLDEERVAHIVSLVNNEAFGQLFISDTHTDRTEKVVKKINQSYKIFNL